MPTLSVFCGSSDGAHPDYLAAAYGMGRALARRGCRVVYGAGRTGLMGALADGALEHGGQVTGVVPPEFNLPTVIHAGLTRLETVASMHQRKARMAELADGFIALPGGYGTFEELFEILTWAQIGLHAKPVGLLNVRGYYDPLLSLVEHARSEGFLYAEQRARFAWDEQPEALLEKMALCPARR
jgi:hypothetical protein